jgi:alkylation response protein AidB-like acyl-CoA dehydrogenase
VDFEFSEDQELLRASVRRFLSEQAPIAYLRALLDDERGTTDDVWAGLADLGAIGLLIPEAHGGADGGMVDMAVVLEELGRAVHPRPFAASAVGAVSLVSLAGSDDDRSTIH